MERVQHETSGMSGTDRNSELLYRLDEKVSLILENQKTQDIAVEHLKDLHISDFKDLDMRLKSVENWRWFIIGISAASGAVVNFIISKITKGDL
jgi:hypothetical protein